MPTSLAGSSSSSSSCTRAGLVCLSACLSLCMHMDPRCFLCGSLTSLAHILPPESSVSVMASLAGSSRDFCFGVSGYSHLYLLMASLSLKPVRFKYIYGTEHCLEVTEVHFRGRFRNCRPVEAVGNLFSFHSLSLPLKSIGTIPRVKQQASGPEAAGLLSGHPLQCSSSLETTEQLCPAQTGSARGLGVCKCASVCAYSYLCVYRSEVDFRHHSSGTMSLDFGELVSH